MSFAGYHDLIAEGDTVIVYEGPSNVTPIVAQAGRSYSNKYGNFAHNAFIGQPFGTKMFAKDGRGWIVLLYPTPELWTIALPHRTQIIYSTDISMITMQLDLKPGSVVVESGTGSASLSHALIRTIAPTGYLHTFEYHADRVAAATREFATHQLSNLVTVYHRDAIKEGFQLNGIADAVVLDLPSPWDAVASAKQALKPSGGRICSFSPCIEQVQRTCLKLRELGFGEIQTVEVLMRLYDVRTVTIPITNMNYSAEDQIARDSPVPATPDQKRPERFTETTISTAKPFAEMAGHTSYLTFATRFPDQDTNAGVDLVAKMEAEAEVGDDDVKGHMQE